MLNKVINVIKDNNLIVKNDKVVIGVSGGSDSMTLLYILNKIKDDIGFEIVACHINHGTRNGESDLDAEFVNSICNKLDIKLYSYSFDLEKESINMKMSPEEAGRKLRYNSFYEVFEKENATKIATAHNLNDNCETVLLNIFRGTGLNGLCGIPTTYGKVIRPLITCTKDEINNYAKENNIPYKEDYTNHEEVYTRNKIRNNLIPYIKENINDNVLSNINKMSDILKDEKDFIDDYASKCYTMASSLYFEQNEDDNISRSIVKINLDVFNDFHVAIKRRILKRAITIINDDSFKDLSQVHIDSVLDIISKGTGKQISILNSIICKVSYNNLLIYKDNIDESDINSNNTNKNVNNKDVNSNNVIIKLDNVKYELANINNDTNKLIPLDKKIEKIASFNILGKEASYRVLDANETKDFIDDLSCPEFIDILKNKSKSIMYFDLDMLLKKTNIISRIISGNNSDSDISIDDNEKDTDKEERNTNEILSNKSSLYFKFRKREDGDKILIDNDNHYKKVKDLFIDDKIEREDRNKIIVFEKIKLDDNKNILSSEIIALLGCRINPMYMVKKDTKAILEIRFDM